MAAMNRRDFTKALSIVPGLMGAAPADAVTPKTSNIPTIKTDRDVSEGITLVTVTYPWGETATLLERMVHDRGPEPTIGLFSGPPYSTLISCDRMSNIEGVEDFRYLTACFLAFMPHPKDMDYLMEVRDKAFALYKSKPANWRDWVS